MTTRAVLSLLLGTMACTERTELQPRDDLAPIERRVALPEKPRAIRWIAVSRNVESGWLESPEQSYDIYAFASSSGTGGKQVSGPRATIELDVALADQLIPEHVRKAGQRTKDRIELTGVKLEPGPVPKEPNVVILNAVRLGDSAFMHIYIGGR